MTMEKSDTNLELFSDIGSGNDYKSVEEYLQGLYGNEDKFIPGTSYENFYSEVNGARGINLGQ